MHINKIDHLAYEKALSTLARLAAERVAEKIENHLAFADVMSFFDTPIEVDASVEKEVQEFSDLLRTIAPGRDYWQNLCFEFMDNQVEVLRLARKEKDNAKSMG